MDKSLFRSDPRDYALQMVADGLVASQGYVSVKQDWEVNEVE